MHAAAGGKGCRWHCLGHPYTGKNCWWCGCCKNRPEATAGRSHAALEGGSRVAVAAAAGPASAAGLGSATAAAGAMAAARGERGALVARYWELFVLFFVVAKLLCRVLRNDAYDTAVSWCHLGIHEMTRAHIGAWHVDPRLWPQHSLIYCSSLPLLPAILHGSYLPNT